ncbi:DUF6542 domain-containing protein [Streptacidiphilus sp. MAP5-3]|uniref:DUF6542 domain-containing protein n=1 Tax=unclassified Streptacidiphilus TaxID=2643834 RepID=UPI003516BDE2
MEYRRSSTQPERNVAVPKPARSPEAASRSRQPRFPAPSGGGRSPQRLTAVGCGVLVLAVTLTAGALDSLLFGSSGWLLGLAYVAVCFHASVRVRSTDLAAAPISGPICFAIALFFFGRAAGDGWSGHVIGLAESLALDAGWLFAGTALSVVIAVARHFSLTRARRKGAQ